MARQFTGHQLVKGLKLPVKPSSVSKLSPPFSLTNWSALERCHIDFQCLNTNSVTLLVSSIHSDLPRRTSASEEDSTIPKSIWLPVTRDVWLRNFLKRPRAQSNSKSMEPRVVLKWNSDWENRGRDWVSKTHNGIIFDSPGPTRWRYNTLSYSVVISRQLQKRKRKRKTWKLNKYL